jgi:hypothetical protein
MVVTTPLLRDMLPDRLYRSPVDLNLFQDIDVVECGSRAKHYRGEWIFGYYYGQTRFLVKALIKIAQQCSAAGQHYTRINNIGGQFRRGEFQGHFYRIEYGIHLFGDGGLDFCRVDGQGFRYP